MYINNNCQDFFGTLSGSVKANFRSGNTVPFFLHNKFLAIYVPLVCGFAINQLICLYIKGL
jgi:hypothetical protein